MSLFPSGLRIRIIKKFDSIIGKPVTQLLPAPVSHPVIDQRSILIIRPGGIGDAVLLAPAINLLRANYADASITVLAEDRNAGVFSLIPAVDKVLRYDNCTDLLHLLFSRFDLIIDTEQWHRMSAILARMVPSSVKIGFCPNERGRLFTHPVSYSQEEYEAQSFLNLLQPLEISGSFDHSLPFLSVPDSAVNEIDTLLEPVTTPFITIFPGASVKERRWGIEKFSLLAKCLSDSGFTPVILGGEEDKISGDIILDGVSGLNLAGKTSIAGSSAVIARSSLLVSGDSGVLHIAVGLGVPTVSLFGAGIVKKWGPQGGNHKGLSRNLSCSPCTLFGTTPVCRYEVRCLEEIKVEHVNEAVNALLFK